uniref:Uncharacterized protein n=1 Tax=Vespula pensylvanica TaxID=30213 RepID=A0A834K4C8_VESPE|nr:hypothetical protein H0235_015946 [Vespula pensylvanica]
MVRHSVTATATATAIAPATATATATATAPAPAALAAAAVAARTKEPYMSAEKNGDFERVSILLKQQPQTPIKDRSRMVVV